MFKNYFRVWTRTKSFPWRSKVFKCDLPRPIVTFLASRNMSVTMDLGFSSGSTSSFLLIQIISFLFLKIFAWSLSLLQACTSVTILHRCTQTVLVTSLYNRQSLLQLCTKGCPRPRVTILYACTEDYLIYKLVPILFLVNCLYCTPGCSLLIACITDCPICVLSDRLCTQWPCVYSVTFYVHSDLGLTGFVLSPRHLTTAHHNVAGHCG